MVTPRFTITSINVRSKQLITCDGPTNKVGSKVSTRCEPQRTAAKHHKTY
jgi:hypothetical protein